MTCTRGPSSLWCKTHAGGQYQQLTTLTGSISTFSLLVKASTSNETLGAKLFPLGFQHLPSAASIHSWVSHPCPLTSSMRNCLMFNMVRAGGQIKGLKVSTVQCQAVSSLHTRVHVAASLPSIRGQMRGNHSISASSTFSSHCSSHLLILHMGSTFHEAGDNTPWCWDVDAWCTPLYFILSEWCWWKGWSPVSYVGQMRDTTTPLSPGYEDAALGATYTVDLTEGVHGHLAFFRACSA